MKSTSRGICCLCLGKHYRGALLQIEEHQWGHLLSLLYDRATKELVYRLKTPVGV